MIQILRSLSFLSYTILFFLLSFIMIMNGRMGIDEGIWTYIARAWVEDGISPYMGTLDDKPPGIILLNSLAYLIEGKGYFFTRALGCISVYITAFFLFKMGKFLINKNCGLISALIFGLSMFWSCLNGPFLGQSEIFMILFSVTAFYCLALFIVYKKRVYLIATGLLFGFALVFKQVAGLSIVAGLLTLLLFFNFNRAKSFCFILGILSLLTFLLLHLPMINSDNLFNYIKFAWLFPNYYETFFWRIPRFIEGFLTNKLMLFYPILLLLVSHRNYKLTPFTKKFFYPWLICAFIGVNISGYYYGHQIIQIIPILSLLAGYVLSRFSVVHQINLSKLTLALMLLFFPYQTFVKNSASILSSAKVSSFSSSIAKHAKGFSDSKKLGKWFKKHTNDSSQIYLLGVTTNVELCYSDRTSASKYFNEMRILGKEIEEKVVQDLAKKKPKLVGISKNISNYDIIKNYVKQNYRKRTNKNNINIFELK